MQRRFQSDATFLLDNQLTNEERLIRDAARAHYQEWSRRRVATRVYFADGDGNDADPILSLVPEERRNTLIARKGEDGVR